ncbi:MAG: energy transducer TonB [Odoribacteraceae bacterium]|jgi:hypothetical protein|nr:energy transducer TonB [Odoribacteraceae bacterium]
MKPSDHIKTYLQGDRRGKAAHRLEEQALSDPFLLEALEGFDQTPNDPLEGITRLERYLDERAARPAATGRAWYWAAAAGIAILGASLWATMGEKLETLLVATRTGVAGSLPSPDNAPPALLLDEAAENENTNTGENNGEEPTLAAVEPAGETGDKIALSGKRIRETEKTTENIEKRLENIEKKTGQAEKTPEQAEKRPEKTGKQPKAHAPDPEEIPLLVEAKEKLRDDTPLLFIEAKEELYEASPRPAPSRPVAESIPSPGIDDPFDTAGETPSPDAGDTLAPYRPDEETHPDDEPDPDDEPPLPTHPAINATATPDRETSLPRQRETATPARQRETPPVAADAPSSPVERDILLFNRHAKTALQYPAIAVKNEEEGRVYLSFQLSPDGTPCNIRVIRDFSSKECTKELVRLLKTSPKWSHSPTGQKLYHVARFEISRDGTPHRLELSFISSELE